MKVIESNDGFIMYNTYPDDSLYIRHLYVKPEARGKGEGKTLEDRLIEKEKPRIIYCDVDLTANDPETTLARIMYKANYKIESMNTHQIVLRKEL